MAAEQTPVTVGGFDFAKPGDVKSVDAEGDYVCHDFMLNRCKRGPRCKWIHDSVLCFHFWKTGSCKKGTDCQQKHHLDLTTRPRLNEIDSRPSVPISRPNPSRPQTLTQTQIQAQIQAQAQALPAGPTSTEETRHDRATKTDAEPSAPLQPTDQPVPPNSPPQGHVQPPTVTPPASLATKKKKRRRGKKRNTESFTPSHTAPQMRVLLDTGTVKSSVLGALSTRDVVLKAGLFSPENGWPADLYGQLCSEVLGCGIPPAELLKPWHGDTHLIADDHLAWKAKCPTFGRVVDAIRAYFGMSIRATRFNWFREADEWKPYHHDAAAVKPEKARTQNFTVGVSFGDTREIAFEDADTRRVVSFPLADGTLYAFTRDVNILWRHGVPQLPPERQAGCRGRISVIAWGWLEQAELGEPAQLLPAQ